MFLGKGDATFGMTLRDQELAAKRVKNACVVTGIRLGMRMTYSVCAPNGSVHSHNCRIGLAEQPERPRHQRQVRHAGILAGRTRRQPVVLAARLERFIGASNRFMGTGKLSHEEADHCLPAHRVEQRR